MIFSRFLRGRNTLAIRFVAIVHELKPGLDARIKSSRTVLLRAPGGSEVICSHDSLSHEIKNSEDENATIKHYVVEMLRNLEPMPDAIETSRVLPLVKPRGWSEQSCLVVKNRPIAISHESEIEIVFVEEVNDQLRFIMQRHLDLHAISVDGLHGIALKNLERLSENMTLADNEVGGTQFLLASLPARYSFNAALVLLPSVWKQVEQIFGESAVCAIPEREMCIFAKSEDGASVSELEKSLVPNLFESAGYPISLKMFQQNNDGKLVVVELTKAN